MANIMQNEISSMQKPSEPMSAHNLSLPAQSELIEKGSSTILEKEEHLFYNLPKYYDMAFERDVDSDIKFFQKCFECYSDVKVKRILEPACGTGMFLEHLPRYGYQAIGYDLSDAMVEYSKLRIQNVGLSSDKADALVGNMKNMIFSESFDAAFVCINSLGYLRNNADISSHFNTMAHNIRKGGIYIAEISCMCNDIVNEKRRDETWCVHDDKITLELTWNPSSYDIANRTRHVDFRMAINDNGRYMEITEAHELRLWFYDEFKKFASDQGFEIVAIYNQNYEKIPLDIPITGELGVLFYVLKNTKSL
jgi:SAM-dependent methyltransferase